MMKNPIPQGKSKPGDPAESAPSKAPQQPEPKGPLPQQATPQQRGASTNSDQSGAPPPKTPPTGSGQPPAKGQVPSNPGKQDGPPEPPPIQMGPSPDLQQAYEFLNQYVQNMGAGALPPDMLNGGEPDASSPLNNLGQALPSTVTGDIKTFPKYSLATGAPNSPGLPTGLTAPTRPAFNAQNPDPRLIGGLPAGMVKANQRKLTNA